MSARFSIQSIYLTTASVYGKDPTGTKYGYEDEIKSWCCHTCPIVELNLNSCMFMLLVFSQVSTTKMWPSSI